MRNLTISCLVLTLGLLPNLAVAASASAYLGQEGRDIKALSNEEENAYLTGKGLGMARAAELNHYPGPAHVLELAVELGLTPEQRARTQALFATMASIATPLGKALVEEERALDRLFSSQTITPVLLARALDRIGSLQAQVRGVHLGAHLTQVEILSTSQRARYDELRGYKAAGQQADSSTKHKH